MGVCSGTSFEKGSISFDLDEENIHLVGPILLTHFGISGPLTFRVSSHLAFEKITKEHPKNILFAPMGDMKKDDWEVFLKNQFSLHPKKTLTNILTLHFSRKFAEAFSTYFFPHLEDIFCGSISRIDREKISNLL